jgi:hypothetical protein
MATPSFGQPRPEDFELVNFAVEDAAPGVGLFGGLRRAPRSRRAPEPVLALGQMRLSIDDGLLMVFGPDGDPVPPRVFSAAAAADPDARLNLPDGTAVAASRVAVVLGAQVLGRLGRVERGNEWIMAMLRERGGPEAASEAELRAEEDAPGARRVPLAVDPKVLAGQAFDALVIRDLPADVPLSAGVYDATINAWVLRPRDLDGLSILPPQDLHTDFTATLLGIALDAKDAKAVRILAQLPVKLA